MVVKPGTETLTSVQTGDLVMVLEEVGATSMADAESVDEIYGAGTEFELSWDMPRIDPLRTPRKEPMALYCMADCQSWSYSEPTITSNVKTVRQVKSDGSEILSALGFLMTTNSSMEVVKGSHFSGIGVHYSDMSSTDPSVITKRSGYSVDGYTGHTATFKMYAPNAVLDWMGIADPLTDWTGFLGDSTSGFTTTKTQVVGGWIMEFEFTFASNKKPASGPPAPAESNSSGYWAEKFSGVVFDDYQGGHVSTGGNSFGGGADYVTLSGDTICIDPPTGYSVTGVHVNQSMWISGDSCYTNAEGGRVDFGISQVPTTAPTAAATATPVGQIQGAMSSSGGTVSNVSSGVTLTFLPGAVSDGTIATISPLTVGETPTIGAGFSLVDTVVEVTVRDAGGNVLSDFSANPVRMCFDYTAGQLLAAGGDTTNLEIVRNPGLIDEGAITSNRVVDNTAQQICVDVTQFSTWAVAARVPTALPVTGTMTYVLLALGVVAVVLLLSGGVLLQWRLRNRY
jgi:LPXTG-motif cell wall-anchored protein